MWTSLAGRCFSITGSVNISESLGAAASGTDLITRLLMEGQGFRPLLGEGWESCGSTVRQVMQLEESHSSPDFRNF